jgi:hypothetical protein
VATSVVKKDAQFLVLPFTAATEFKEQTAPYTILSAWVIASATHANGTAQLVNGDVTSVTAITDAMACDTINARIDSAAITLGNASIAAGGSISVKVANGATGTVVLLVRPDPIS